MRDVEGIGDVLTGGIVAREVEGVAGHGGVAAGHDPHEGAGGECLNCGTIRTGPFCQQCGQSGHVHRNVTALGHDILHGVFHFEGKFWTTLPMLVRKPGELTRRYVHGERARFVSPMALFLFSVFLLFASVNRLTMPDVAGAAQGLAKAKVQMAEQAKDAQDKLNDLTKSRQEALAADPRANVSGLDQQIKDTTAEVASLKIAAAHLPTTTAEAEKAGSVKAGDKTYNFNVEDGVKGMNVDTGFSVLNRQIAHVKDNPALYAYKLKMASYKFSWALIPISVPFIWLLFFWRRDVGIYDHAIFAIHSLSFMTLLTVGLIGLYFLGVRQGFLWLVFLITPPIHMYKHLKGAYQLGRFGAFWRTWTLLIMTSIASGLFFAFLVWLESE